ncbi:MAG: peptidase M20 [Candidatus Dojkabacteria bacterium]|nr:MAG: peptidase M20 [Candidatus Dojkabacteria bacterium]
MLEDILKLSQAFIRIRSTAESKDKLDEILKLALSYLNNYTVERFENEGKPSALIYKANTRPSKFKLILNGHLDVVPGREDLYEPRIEGDKLIGVGALDMKASAACLIYAFLNMVDKVSYPLGLQLVTDEEIGGFNGTKYQILNGVTADFVICGEPTNFDIVNKAKGIIWLKINFKGITAHGAYPWRGKNAILLAHNFLSKLFKRFNNPKEAKWQTTINLARIETSNNAFNKIPDDCTIWLDIRYTPEDKDRVLQEIHQILPKDTSVEIMFNEPSLYTEENNVFIQNLTKSIKFIIQTSTQIRYANGSSDARHYMNINVPGIEFGPVGGNIGGDEEWVSIKGLEQYFEILQDFLLRIDSDREN